jgi:hypothetical protein
VTSAEASTIGTVHLRDRCRRSRRRRHFVHREIGDLADKSFVQFRIAIRETPMSGGQLSACVGTHREIRDRESWRHVHGDIENIETLMRGLTKVMCRWSCRPRPIASRASAWKGAHRHRGSGLCNDKVT